MRMTLDLAHSRYPFIVLLLLCAISTGAQANGLSDLHSALEKLSEPTSLTGTVHADVWRATGEGDDRFEVDGEASVTISTDEESLQVHYDRNLLSRLEAEEEAVTRDPNADTPAQEAVRGLSLNQLRPMVSTASHLRRQIEGAEFQGETTGEHQGESVRVLTFQRDISTVSERQRKYVRNFDSTLDIWIADDGTPLKSHARMELSGRAFIFIRFRHKEEDRADYAEHNGRLLTLRHEATSKSSGGGESQETRTVKTLKPQGNQ